MPDCTDVPSRLARMLLRLNPARLSSAKNGPISPSGVTAHALAEPPPQLARTPTAPPSRPSAEARLKRWPSSGFILPLYAQRSDAAGEAISAKIAGNSGFSAYTAGNTARVRAELR